MKYMGSKSRVAKDISPIINKIIKDNGIKVYIEPFVGGANMIQHIQCDSKTGYDNNRYLIAFLKAIQSGWNPLNQIQMSKDVYQDIKENPDKYSAEVVALAGFCATYNAKWFGGYAGIVKTKDGIFRNYYDEAVRNVIKQAEYIKNIHFQCMDYRQINIEGALIYCDPPYQQTTGYKDDFDHEAYWQWLRKMSEKTLFFAANIPHRPILNAFGQRN